MHRLNQFILMIISHLPGKRWHKVHKLVLVDPCDPEKKMVIYARLKAVSTSSRYYVRRSYKVGPSKGGMAP